MLRNLYLTTLAIALATSPGAHAQQMGKADPAPVVAQSGAIPSQAPDQLYRMCAFYPKPGTCEEIYRHAMQDSSISAEAVRAEYNGYARYLTGATSLTDVDRQYLKENGIRMPYELSADNQAGLHNVINDPTLDGDAKRAAINNFLSRAVQAELYCSFNSCDDSALRTSAAGV